MKVKTFLFALVLGETINCNQKAGPYCVLKGFAKKRNDSTIVTAFRHVVTEKKMEQ